MNNVIIPLLIFVLALSSCDLINSGKKAAPKKTEPSAAAQESAAVIDEDSPLASNEVARVGQWTLTSEQFEQRLKLLKEGMPDFDASKPGTKEAVLNELVRQQLLVQDAKQSDIGNSKDINEAVEDFRNTLLVQELANRLTKDVAANEKEAQEYYNQNKDLFVTQVQWGVREIVVPDETTAKNILVQVLQGGSFADIAKEQSKGKSAAKGGEVAPFVRAPFPAMQTAIASLEAGGTSAVFKGPEGFYIVRVESKKGGETKTFDEVKKDLVAGLTLRKQQEAILDHIDKLSAKIKVQVNKNLVGTPNGK